jgi:xanthine dehydrogenase small subunit
MTLEFYLNGNKVRESVLEADITLLRYLRLNKNLIGTKEGCASGDCGACTVLVGSHLVDPYADAAQLHAVAHTDTLARTSGYWRYKSMNSCILFLSQLADKSVVTVEYLSSNLSDTLHPAQQALVDHHGSQCGFCTPGFVMSMVGLYEDGRQAVSSEGTKKPLAQKTDATPKPTISTTSSPVCRQDVEIALSGNLCRCTGYRPIIDAAIAMFDAARYPPPNAQCQTQPQTQTKDCVGMLQPGESPAVTEPVNISLPSPTVDYLLHDNLPHDDSLHGRLNAGDCLKGNRSESWVPKDEKSLVDLLCKHPDATLVAGATDLALRVTQQYQQFPKLISLNEIDGLKRVQIDNDTITVGAATCYRDLEPLFNEFYPEFGAMLYRLGSQQIRNSGTLGGNIVNASPVGDTPPVLLALGAKIELAGASGRRTIPLVDFFLDYKITALQPGEYLRAIIIPKLKDQEVLKVYKISKRLEDDISAVLMAIKLGITDGVITSVSSGFGGMAAIPKKAQALESALNGKPLCQETFLLAKNTIDQDFSPISDVRASSHYRLAVTKGLIEKCGIELCGSQAKQGAPAVPTRIEQLEGQIDV